MLYITQAQRIKPIIKEVAEMLEFTMTIAVMTLTFVGASLAVAIMAGGILKVTRFLTKKTVNEAA